MLVTDEEYLMHYGILRKSGRYPWGSGRNKLQRSKTFLDIIEQHQKVDGMSLAEIAKAYSPVDKDGNVIPATRMTTNDIRALKSRAIAEVKQEQIRTAQRLRDKGMGYSEIAKRMSTPEKTINESTVRSLLEPGRLDKLDIVRATADMLKRQVEEKEFVDVGANVEKDLPIGRGPSDRMKISPDKFKTALSMLKEEGYSVHPVHITQRGTGKITKYLVLVKPGVSKRDAFMNRDKIRLISEKTPDHGRTWENAGFKPPLHIDAKRVGIRYKEEGGANADGVIYVRPGVDDISLGKSRYAQVRVAVGGTHYLKGMAVYKDDLPDGVDLQFNTNKSNTGNKLDAMKPLKRDKATGEVDTFNPFGAIIKDGGQILGSDGKPKSVMNLVNEEGDWDKWSKAISSQVLSKQSPDLARSQLDLTYARRREEFESIKSLTNPQIRRKLLETFAEGTDSSAVHMKAASMHRQATKVILPSNRVKETEIFAPTFRDGERVALVRYPHAGLFEIPELVVNNKSREARSLVGLNKGGTAIDAVVIHPRVAEHLSGADFDGDSVVVIPNDRGKIAKKPPLEGLKGFDPQATYKVPLGPKTAEFPDGTPTVTPSQKQSLMGITTNLISDMTLRGANNSELARAVRHSMVVIDSEKHNLDVKASARDNGIMDLKRRYQGVHPKTGQVRGASTLITRAPAEYHVPRRKDAPSGPGLVRVSSGTIDIKTGKKVYEYTGELKKKTVKDPVTGEKRTIVTNEKATFKSKKLAETDDAYTLVSEGRGTTMEQIYADHSNRLKSMANEVRREVATTKPIPYSRSANKVYKAEVESLKAKLHEAEKNSPLERQAQVVAGRIYAQKKRANPDMDKDEQRKINGQALTEARLRTGAGKTRLGSKKAPITDREWEAIQAGAISNEMMKKILNNADLDAIRDRATPPRKRTVSSSIASLARQRIAAGWTLSQVAEDLGIPVSTLAANIEQ